LVVHRLLRPTIQPGKSPHRSTGSRTVSNRRALLSSSLSQVIESLRNEVASLQGDLNQLRQQKNLQTIRAASQSDDGTREQQPQTLDESVPRLEPQNETGGQRNIV